MAQRTPRGGSSRAAPRASARSRKPGASEVEVVEEAPGIGFEAGVAIFACLAALAALVMIDKLLGMFGEGIFFK